MSDLPVAPRPCAPCPWRVDAEPGKFTDQRYEELRASCRDDALGTAQLDAPLFACHARTSDAVCAGWLAREGLNHVGIRLAAITGRLDPERLHPGDGWPPLHEDYEALLAAQHPEQGP